MTKLFATIILLLNICALSAAAQSDFRQEAEQRHREFMQRAKQRHEDFERRRQESRARYANGSFGSRSSRQSQSSRSWNQGNAQPASSTVQYYGSNPPQTVNRNQVQQNPAPPVTPPRQAARTQPPAAVPKPVMRKTVPPKLPAAKSTARNTVRPATAAGPQSTVLASVKKSGINQTKATGKPNWSQASTSAYAAKFRHKTNLDAMAYSPPKKSATFDWNRLYRATINGGIIGALAGAAVYLLIGLSKLFGASPSPAVYKAGSIMALAVTIPLASTSLRLPVVGEMLDKAFPSTKEEPARADTPSEPVEYWAPIARCEITMHGPIRKEKMGAFGLNLDCIGCTEKDGARMLAYGLMPKLPTNVYAMTSTPQLDVQKSLDGAANGAVQGMHATATSIRPYELNGYAGREVVANLPDKKGLARMRIFLAHERIYQVLVVGIPSFTNSGESTAFLNSFKILD